MTPPLKASFSKQSNWFLSQICSTSKAQMMMYQGRWAGNDHDPIFKVVPQKEERKLKSSVDIRIRVFSNTSQT
jgi:hypothetical protein